MNTSSKLEPVENLGWSALFAGHNKFKAIALGLGVVLHATNVFLSTTIMPSIIEEIGGLEYYAWNTTIFVVASVIGSVVSAHMLATNGPRKAYRISTLAFALGTVVCMLAPAMYIMLLGRFIQGIGGGLLFALSYAMIRVVFAEGLWPRAMAMISGMWGVAAFSGPLIGGVFAQYDQWRMAFGTILLISLILIVITELILPLRNDSDSKTAIPYLKLTFLTASALAVSIGSLMENWVLNLLGLAVAVFFIVILVWRENKGGVRLLPTGSYNLSSTLGITYVIMILLALSTTIEIFVPYFAQVIHGFSPLKAGYITVLIAFGWNFASLLFSGIKKKFVNTLVFIGSLLMAIGLAGLSFLFSLEYTLLHILLICVSLFLVGAGIGMGWPHLLTRIFSLAPAGEEELASSSVTTVQLMAMAFGAAIAGLIANVGGLTKPGGIIGAEGASVLLFGSFALAPLMAALMILFYWRKITTHGSFITFKNNLFQ
jgi:MFS family permease